MGLVDNAGRGKVENTGVTENDGENKEREVEESSSEIEEETTEIATKASWSPSVT